MYCIQIKKTKSKRFLKLIVQNLERHFINKRSLSFFFKKIFFFFKMSAIKPRNKRNYTTIDNEKRKRFVELVEGNRTKTIKQVNLKFFSVNQEK